MRLLQAKRLVQTDPNLFSHLKNIKENIQKVRHLKWQRLIQYNLLFYILFLVSIYFVWSNKPDYLFLGILCLLLWMIAAQRLYASVTGETVGTNRSKLIQSFEKYK